MSPPAPARLAHRRPVMLAAAALGCAVVGGAWWSARAADAEHGRALAGAELSTFERCLIGEPLRPGEALAGRIRGIELALELQRDARDMPAARPDKAEALEDEVDAGADAGPAAPPPPTAAEWPARCAPLADALARRLDGAALRADDRLEALREALPTRQRLELGYALLPEEAADFTAALARASLPAAPPATEIERAPTALEPPAAMPGLAPLGTGKLADTGIYRMWIALATDVLETKTLRLLVRDAAARLCALDGDAAAARCGGLPAWAALDETSPRLAYLEEGAPTALFASTSVGGGHAFGVAVLSPGGIKTLPMTDRSGVTTAFLAADGGYALTSSTYGAFVRVGAVDKLKTTGLSEKALDATAVRALDVGTDDAIAAYGWVFWTGAGKLRGRRVLPSMAADVVDLGRIPGQQLELVGGCRGGGRTALLFAEPARGRQKKQTARLVLADGDGPFRGLDAEVGTTVPHLRCAPDAALVTSVAADKEHGTLVVTQSRCTAAGCEAHDSEPIPAPTGGDFDAAATEPGVVMVWRARADRALSRDRGMVFYRVAPLDKLAATPPRPLLENHRRGGLDVDRLRLLPHGAAAIVALESGGRAAQTYAVRIDAAGVATPVRVEETRW